MSMRKRKKIQTLLRAVILGRPPGILPLLLLVLGCAGWVSGVTASDGTFRVVIPVQPVKLKYYLSFFDQRRFDDVRFARPSCIDITRKVGAEKFILYDHQLAFHGAWPNVQEILKAYPKKSPRARVIRRYGIAEEIRKDKDGKKAEIWWYYPKGKRFDFRDGKTVSEKSFSPVFK